MGSSPAAPTVFALVSELRVADTLVTVVRRARYVRERNRVFAHIRRLVAVTRDLSRRVRALRQRVERVVQALLEPGSRWP